MYNQNQKLIKRFHKPCQRYGDGDDGGRSQNFASTVELSSDFQTSKNKKVVFFVG